MNVEPQAMKHLFRKSAFALVATALVASTFGCSASQGHSLRSDLAVLRSAHNDPDDIGSIDATTTPPADLDQYRRANNSALYQTVSATNRR